VSTIAQYAQRWTVAGTAWLTGLNLRNEKVRGSEKYRPARRCFSAQSHERSSKGPLELSFVALCGETGECLLRA
jgi:hypothetical protein